VGAVWTFVFFGVLGGNNQPMLIVGIVLGLMAHSFMYGPQAAFIETLLDGGTIDIHGDGQQIRTFTYVSDTVDGFMRALMTPTARGEVVNIGGETPTPILELAGLVQETMGIPQPLRARFVPYDQLPGRYQDVRVRIPDTTKAQQLLGFRAQVPLRAGLEHTLAWHLHRRAVVTAAARA